MASENAPRVVGPPPHQKLDVYQRALEVVVIVHDVSLGVSPMWFHMRDQMLRSASSIVLNLAEGTAEFSPKEKARFYRMSRRSAAETLGALDVLHATHGRHPREADARSRLEEVMAKLTRLIHVQVSRER